MSSQHFPTLGGSLKYWKGAENGSRWFLKFKAQPGEQTLKTGVRVGGKVGVRGEPVVGNSARGKNNPRILILATSQFKLRCRQQDLFLLE